MKKEKRYYVQVFKELEKQGLNDEQIIKAMDLTAEEFDAIINTILG